MSLLENCLLSLIFSVTPVVQVTSIKHNQICYCFYIRFKTNGTEKVCSSTPPAGSHDLRHELLFLDEDRVLHGVQCVPGHFVLKE